MYWLKMKKNWQYKNFDMYFIKKVDSKNISIFRIHFYPKFGAMVCVNNIILLLLFYNKYFYYSLNYDFANK